MHPLLPFWDLEMPPSDLQRRQVVDLLTREIEETGEAELPRLGLFVQPGDFVMDVGANIGTYSLAMSRLGARVLALEPNPQLAQMLDWMAFSKVEVRRIALSDECGEAELSFPDGNPDMGTLMPHGMSVAGSTVKVAMQTLDETSWPLPAFIKIDVEGAEEKVLAGGMKFLSHSRPTLLIEIEERHNPGGLDRIVKALKPLGYDASFLKSGEWVPVAEFDPVRDQDETVLEVKPWVRRKIRYINNFLFSQESVTSRLQPA